MTCTGRATWRWVAVASMVAACAYTDGAPAPGQSHKPIHGSGLETVERVVVAMGTSLQLTVTATTRMQALQASEAALLAIETVEARLSTWRDDSELTLLNRLPVAQWTSLSGPLLRDLQRARRWSRATGRAFDPGVGALVDLYGLRAGGAWPSDEAVWACLPHATIQELHVIRTSAKRRKERLRIEEGGFGKGAGLDAAARAVLDAGATAATFDFGGQVVRVGFDAAETTDYDVADPNQRTRPAVRVRVGNGSLATTANSERRIEVDGRSLGHILDPRTGRPAPDFGSVTVFADSAFDADCLSTALFVMGPAAALAWAERHDGIEALVIESDTAAKQLIARTTSGLRDRVSALAPNLKIEL